MPAAPRLSYALGLVRQLFDARSRLAAELASISNVFRFEGTAMTDVTFTLPDDLARQAESAGLLRSEVVAALLRDAIRERRVEESFASIERLHAVEPPLTEDDVDAEIVRARAERRAYRR